MEPIRIGIVGTNFVSDWLAEAAEQTTSCKAAAVYSRTEETGKAFAAKHGIPSVFTDYSSFLSSGRIDAVYLASPNSIHYAQALEAIKHGLHVLCEKPAALNGKQLAVMERTARENKVVILEAMRPAYDPATEKIESLISEIGQIRRAVFRMNQYSSRYDAFLRGEIKNAFNPSLGNAAIMDIGVYCVFLCARLFGRPERVQADSVFLSNGFEGEGTLLLGYTGMQVLIEYSKITNSQPGCVIEGEKGYITFDRVNGMNEICIYRRGAEPEKLSMHPVENNMIYELDVFAKAIRTGSEHEKYLNVTRIQTEIMDAARAAVGICFSGENDTAVGTK